MYTLTIILCKLDLTKQTLVLYSQYEFGNLFAVVCSMEKYNSEEVAFVFNHRIIQSKDTPFLLNLKDGDIIHVLELRHFEKKL